MTSVSAIKNQPAMKTMGSVPGLGRASAEGNGNQLQYSCLENPMDRGAWQATVHRGCERVRHNSDLTKQLEKKMKNSNQRHIKGTDCLESWKTREETA